ncbi:MAG TPA: peptidase, partial [Candidatus Kapabacteria bacterium]|nr:peptidase [Candidatus Kapabacteria bacterium]
MESQPELSEQAKKIKQLSEQFAKIEITADVSHLSQRERALLEKLIEAGKLCDAIFWKQSSHDAIAVRDSLIKLNTEEAKIFLEYVNINYGPYDVLNENVRFVGVGPEKRPPGGGFYPEDITKEEFENHIKNNPKDKEAFESQYSVIVRENGGLKAIPYHHYYPETEKLAKLLEEAAELADNPTLKNYLILRAKATRTDDYYESDMAWMDIENSNIDVIIGPIENYSDALYNYKTAYEAVVMVKDIEASKELEMFQKHIPDFQNNLPYDKKFIEPVKTEKEILQIVNVVYFGGDCQKGTKTIAAALPNDPRVHETKGGKKSMFKNMMEAKFKTIVVPIANEIIAPELRGYVDSKAFTSFVTLHEVSHTLGRGYVYGSKDLTVRKALKERYSAIEETKADILSMFNHQTLLKLGKL